MQFCLFFTIGGGTVDSEKIRILSSPSNTSENINNTFNNHRSTEQCSSFTGESCTAGQGYRRKRTSSNEINNESHQERHFCDGSNPLSPSDLHHSWKRRRSSMNGRIPGDGLQRSKSECTISIQRNPVDKSYIDEKYGIMPSESTSEKVIFNVRYQFECILSN